MVIDLIPVCFIYDFGWLEKKTKTKNKQKLIITMQSMNNGQIAIFLLLFI